MNSAEEERNRIKEKRVSLGYIKADVVTVEDALDKKDKASAKYYAEDLKKRADELINSLKEDNWSVGDVINWGIMSGDACYSVIVKQRDGSYTLSVLDEIGIHGEVYTALINEKSPNSVIRRLRKIAEPLFIKKVDAELLQVELNQEGK